MRNVKIPAGLRCVLAGIALFYALPAAADMVTYTTSLQSGNMCTGCGPFTMIGAIHTTFLNRIFT